MPKGDIRNKREYVDWICRVRRQSGLNQEEFGSRIVRFGSGSKSSGRMYNTYGRGAVAHWEKGTHLPVNVETVISIALLDYAELYPEQDFSISQAVDSKLRNKRLIYVASCIQRYLNRGLYCKNLGDVLIFQAIRGLFPLEEVPELETWIHREIFSGSRKNTLERVREYSRRRDTGMLYDQLLEMEDKETFLQVLQEKKDFYSIGYRVVGERMKEEYEAHYMSDSGLDFQRAIRFYAPVYRDSYQHLFAADIRVSRRWLIDLCIQLHFSRESINSVLKNAQYTPLADYPENPEAWIQNLGQEQQDRGQNQWRGQQQGYFCGTVVWYHQMENQYLLWKEENGDLDEIREDGALESDFEPFRFWRVREYSLRERLIYALALGCYLEKYGELPLPVYLLDFVLARKDAEEMLKRLSCTVGCSQWGQQWNLWKQEKKGLCLELCYLIRDAMDDVVLFAMPGEPEVPLLHDLEREYQGYYEISEKKLSGERAFQKQHIFASVLYSLMTGFLYKGKINRKECEELKELQEKFPEAHTFIRYIWRLYLGNEPVEKSGEDCFRVVMKKGTAPELNLEKMMGILAEILESEVL